LHLHRGGERFADLGGLSALKDFCLRAMRRQGDPDPLRRPKGVLLLSPAGCGKSSFFKCLGNETGRPTVILDVGALYGGLVGQTEANVRRALATIDAMQPAVVAVDELEKALAGVGGSQGDGGVSARLFGTLLTWLNDRDSDVFVVCTCNDISKLPPEFSRAERFDGLFFIDLPTAEERQSIWDICLRTFSLDPSRPRPNDEGWTGAEIRSCCRLAALLDVPLLEAAKNVVPVSRTAAESVERLRRWASGRCLSADKPGLYEYGQADGGRSKSRRRVDRDPSQN
jgi:SpoVK/Ycf46/Vps4 family AAA+-type ATPase